MTATNIPADEFAGQEQSATVHPWLQIVNAKNLPLKEIAKFNIPWGFFVPREQAEKVRFKPDANWKSAEIDFGEETKSGYLTTHPRFVVIQRSQPECYQRNSYGGWSYKGLYFGDRNGSINWYEKMNSMSFEEKENIRSVTRYLFKFVSSDNTSLHEGSLQIKLRGASGLAIKQALNDYYVSFEKAFYESINRPAARIGAAGRARVVVDFTMGLSKPSDKNPQIFVESMLSPSLALGANKNVDSKGHTINHVGCNLSDILILKSSKTGQEIHNIHEETLDFAKPGGGKIARDEFEGEETKELDPDLMPF